MKQEILGSGHRINVSSIIPEPNTLGFRVKLLGEQILSRFIALESGCFSQTFFQISSRKLLSLSKEAGSLSSCSGILKNLSDVISEITLERKELIKTARILLEDLFLRYETGKYRFTSFKAFSGDTIPIKDFKSLRMKEANLIPDIKLLLRDHREREAKFKQKRSPEKL